MSGYRDRLGNHQDHARIAAALEESSGIYSGMSSLEKQIARAFDEARTGKVWKTRFYKYATNNTSAGTKMLDNAGMEIPTPATDSVEGSDPYLKYGVFRWQRCNYVRDDSDGFARPTALKGWPGYKEEGAVDVGTLKMTFYWKYEEGATYYDIIMSDTPHPELGLVPWCDAVKIDADGNKTVMPYFIVSSYTSVIASDGLLRSQPGTPAYNQSYDNMVTNYAKKGAGYHGAPASRNGLWIIWNAIKYATKNSQKVMAGVSIYDSHIKVAAAESGVKRVLVAKASAGSFSTKCCVSITKTGAASTIDRQSADCHTTVDRAEIQLISTVTVSGTEYTALYLDVDSAFTTDTGMYVVTMPAKSGATDCVIGLYDGSPVSYSDGKHPIRMGGVEYQNGQYIVASDVVMEFQSDYSKNVYVAERPTKHVADAHTNYKLIGNIPNSGSGTDYWSGDKYGDLSTGAFFPASIGGGDSVGTGDRVYAGGANTSGLREYLMVANLRNGSTSGACSVNCGSTLGDVYWTFSSAD